MSSLLVLVRLKGLFICYVALSLWGVALWSKVQQLLLDITGLVWEPCEFTGFVGTAALAHLHR